MKRKTMSISMGASIAIGVGIGAAVGVATDNIGFWIAIGVAIGAAVGTAIGQVYQARKLKVGVRSNPRVSLIYRTKNSSGFHHLLRPSPMTNNGATLL